MPAMTHITIEREALQTVLDTLEENHHLIEQYERSEYLALYDRQITVIKQALAAQQEHEPENEPYVSLASVQEPSYETLWHKVWPDAGSFVRASADDLKKFAKAVSAAPAPITPAEVHGMAEAHGIDNDARHWYVVGITDSEKHHGITKGQP